MVVLLSVARAVGLTDMNLGLFLGSAVTRDFSLATWLLGFVIHLAAGAAFAVVYAALFERWQGASWWQGVIIALPHILIAGAIMWGVGLVHPLVPRRIDPPGYMLALLGAPTAITYMLMHLVFGATVGAIYSAGRRAAPRRTFRRARGQRPVHA